ARLAQGRAIPQGAVVAIQGIVRRRPFALVEAPPADRRVTSDGCSPGRRGRCWRRRWTRRGRGTRAASACTRGPVGGHAGGRERRAVDRDLVERAAEELAGAIPGRDPEGIGGRRGGTGQGRRGHLTAVEIEALGGAVIRAHDVIRGA